MISSPALLRLSFLKGRYSTRNLIVTLSSVKSTWTGNELRRNRVSATPKAAILTPIRSKFSTANLSTAGPSSSTPKSPAANLLPSVPRVNIGIFGSMNVGKSTLMNLLTQSNTSIVDGKPGTTADTKIATIEMHRLGPCKLFDTAGLNEEGELGEKKRAKTMTNAKESDLLILVVDTRQGPSSWDREIIQMAKQRQKKVLVLLNEFSDRVTDSFTERTVYEGFPAIRLKLNVLQNMNVVADFIEEEYKRGDAEPAPLLPLRYMGYDKRVLLVIPMDAETPGGRLLRPQARIQEFCLSHYTTTVAFRLDLAAGRSKEAAAVAKEKARFQKLIEQFAPHLVITDSQAMDLVNPWLDADKYPDVDLTTFSVVMINDMSGGRINDFMKGITTFQHLDSSKKVLIAEACNHNRLVSEVCADISTCQIPRKMDALYGKDAVKVEHAFGREFPDMDLKDFGLVIHCGGCMVDKQKIQARVQDCVDMGVPITNFGLLLSWFSSPNAVARVVRPLMP